jgi:hypothetical protein
MDVEVWLRTNARAVLFGLALPVAIGVVGLGLCLGLPGHEPAGRVRVLGIALVAFALATIVSLLLQLRQPRLAYWDGKLLIWLRAGAPFRVPIEAVECFWLGQAPSLLPGKRHTNTETATLVVRIADKAVEWRHQEVKTSLGSWCEGYVTIRGTWCEKLSIELVNRLNQRLAEVSKSAEKTAL